jgi:amino acid adenylation domain-containing protein
VSIFDEQGAGGSSPLRAAFLASAALYPDHVALCIGRRRWTYAEIEDRARRWAARLIDAAHGPPRRVGVFGYRSETAYVGVLASLLVGAAFVPLNPNYPQGRNRLMVRRADLDAILVDEAALPQLAGILGGQVKAPAVLLSEGTSDGSRAASPTLDRRELDRTSPLSEWPEVSPDDVAYLLFTSGSTGEPKGVPITHANVGHFLHVNLPRYRLTPNDRMTQFFDPTFDLSIFDLFMAWASGAAVCSPGPMQMLAPTRFVDELGITVWFSVPSLPTLLIRKGLVKPGSLPGLRWSLFCGEALPRRTAELWQDVAPNSIIENLYGPTELTIACSVYRWNPSRSPGECVNEIVPIGPLYSGLDPRIVDEELQAIPEGGAGELCVAGPQTFPGYWRDPEATRSRFFTISVSDGRAPSYYRTGDLVRRLESGDLVYLGRVDHQIKVRGYRIDPGEVEAILLERPGALQAAAIGWPVEHGTAHGIVAFVTGEGLDPKVLTEALMEQLPAYLVPVSVQVIPEMPLNANGKVDRRALAALLDREGR